MISSHAPVPANWKKKRKKNRLNLDITARRPAQSPPASGFTFSKAAFTVSASVAHARDEASRNFQDLGGGETTVSSCRDRQQQRGGRVLFFLSFLYFFLSPSSECKQRHTDGHKKPVFLFSPVREGKEGVARSALCE